MKTLTIKIKTESIELERQSIYKGNIELKDNGEVHNSFGTKIGSWK